MTDIDIDAIRARWQDIQNTPQPGLVTDRLIFAEQSADDVPDLLAKVAELTAELERVRLGSVEMISRAHYAEQQLAVARAELADARNQAHRDNTDHQQTIRAGVAYANEIAAKDDENLRLREQVFAQQPVIEAALAWAEMCEDGGLAPDDCRKTEDALHDAVEQYRLMDLALTTAREEKAQVA